MTSLQLAVNAAPLLSSYEPVDEAGRVLAAVLFRLEDGDREGAHAGVRDWCDTLAWRKIGGEEVATLASMLVDEVAELMAERRNRTQTVVEPPVFCPERDGYGFDTSSHLSLLTAAVLRQRAQIAELLGLVETLSRRLG